MSAPSPTSSKEVLHKRCEGGIENPDFEEYPFVELSTMIFIDQDDDDKDLFHVTFINREKRMRQVLELGRKDTEALERQLIATGKTTQAGRIQFVPTLVYDDEE